MNLSEHHESLVMFVYLQSRVQMFFSLTRDRRSKSSGPSRHLLPFVVHSARHTYMLEVFDEEKAHAQIMTDLLEGRKCTEAHLTRPVVRCCSDKVDNTPVSNKNDGLWTLNFLKMCD